MKRLLTGALALTLLVGTAGVAAADNRPNQYNQYDRDGRSDRNNGRYDNAACWSRGDRISQRDWSRGRPVVYRDYGLTKAPKGYAWREFDGTFIQAQRNGGYISAVVVSRDGDRNGNYRNARYNNSRCDDGRGNRREWRRGERMERSDWDRGRRVDYREYDLSRPERGYEWREVDGDYVQAEILTGLIIAVIQAQRQ